jgi:predicted nucleotidyltransferase
MEQTDQIQATHVALRRVLGDALIAVYLHGSAVSGKLQPQSDIDLLVVVDRDVTSDQRDELLTELMQISGRHPAAPGGPRCIEVIVFRLSDLSEDRFPMRAELTYGEWLRDAFESGEKPMPARDPEYTLVLAQARQEAIPLSGPDRTELLPEVSTDVVRQAMRDLLPGLMDGLQGDERNVLLTLARMWRTASAGDFVSKGEAALWAIPQMPAQDAAMLDYARSAYLGQIIDDWGSRRNDAKLLAEYLSNRVVELL